MKNNEEILAEFGSLKVKDVYDDKLKFINNDIEDLKQTKGYKNLFGDLSDEGFQELKNYTESMMSGHCSIF